MRLTTEDSFKGGLTERDMYGRAGFVPVGRQGTVLSVSQDASPARLGSPACSPPIRPLFLLPPPDDYRRNWRGVKRRNRRRGA